MTNTLIEITHVVSVELFRSMKPQDLKKLLGEEAYTKGVQNLAGKAINAAPPAQTPTERR